MIASETLSKIVSLRLKLFRKIHRMSQSEIATKSKMSMRNYQRIEACELSPKLETINDIANVYNISTTDFLPSSKVDAQFHKISNLDPNHEKAQLLLKICKNISPNDLKNESARIEFFNKEENKKLNIAYCDFNRLYLNQQMQLLLGLEPSQKLLLNKTLEDHVAVKIWSTYIMTNVQLAVTNRTYNIKNKFYDIISYVYIISANEESQETISICEIL
jgi:transcriptional regulator with XRE-family HTH domain